MMVCSTNCKMFGWFELNKMSKQKEKWKERFCSLEISRPAAALNTVTSSNGVATICNQQARIGGKLLKCWSTSCIKARRNSEVCLAPFEISEKEMRLLEIIIGIKNVFKSLEMKMLWKINENYGAKWTFKYKNRGKSLLKFDLEIFRRKLKY